MPEFIEAPIEDWIASFDGRVLEIFMPYIKAAMRYHVRLLTRSYLDGTMFMVTTGHQDIGAWPFTEAQRPAVAALANAVEAARVAVRGTPL